ncbi:alpha/beta hydrolase [Fictibacillus aquaticus]|uniref:Alpha/beta hydrolase n=1 Tax=Fictibacillus aquaticus TaxID=2021314 RepID=A0A235FAQ7_9BACL|nr:alpha/beta hydrolase [Fictibacillus aquaticus]OYD57845.1 alpha/beta hydrolase [Fictibacillus aquaticus]
MKAFRGKIKGYNEMNVPYTLLSKNENASTLAIMLPGLGYTTEGPLFHYSTGMFLNDGHDVLQVNYQYFDEAYDEFSVEELDKAIEFDSEIVVASVLEERSYENFYLIGKSIGTIAMSSLLKKDVFHDAKAVWLTPLLNVASVYQAIKESPQKGLCLIGSQDRHYSAEKYYETASNEHITFRLIEGADHSLEYPGKTLESLTLLNQLFKHIGETIER